jgi:hypothetical protein
MSVAHPRSVGADETSEPHRVRVQVEVELDPDFVHAIAERSGQRVEHVLAEIASDLECRTHDACRWKDGVVAVRVHTT